MSHSLSATAEFLVPLNAVCTHHNLIRFHMIVCVWYIHFYSISLMGKFPTPCILCVLFNVHLPLCKLLCSILPELVRCCVEDILAYRFIVNRPSVL